MNLVGLRKLQLEEWDDWIMLEINSSSQMIIIEPTYVHLCHVTLLHKSYTIMNAHETPLLKTFKLCALQKLYNLSTILSLL